jgi:hypothetical protein
MSRCQGRPPLKLRTGVQGGRRGASNERLGSESLETRRRGGGQEVEVLYAALARQPEYRIRRYPAKTCSSEQGLNGHRTQRARACVHLDTSHSNERRRARRDDDGLQVL